ncbi:hypothetical protein AGDE_15287 [Angomonas deanei]|uniref:Ras family/Ras of Complex, Roc, domain of DAPkinase, putative n=1 Tax=Angomonas deanei TaxID=59799 RepID=A0A7G2CNE4_9TRYP|nr:hypothetical protein AGDE_15287 [Angomonas deanei]CAD2220975.1 Ras family/Ras of Complex, Roc, domain of DAPkinase, putative [Angomonas deanei]|eukprot:EPY19350.1 hypothetical protein AGDE_15287 [Angomonas deanei]
MPFSYKIVLLGEGRVGKTSLLSRYVHDKFNANEPTTESGVMFTQCVVPVDPAALPPAALPLRLAARRYSCGIQQGRSASMRWHRCTIVTRKVP